MDKPVSQMTPNEQRSLHARGGRPHPGQLPDTRRSTSRQALASRQPPRQQYFTPGGFRDAREGAIAGIFAPCVIHAADKRLAQGEPQGNHMYAKAFGHALSVVWQWKSWAFTLLYWVVSGASLWFWMDAEAMQGIAPASTRLLQLHAARCSTSWAIGVPYCQAVDASFFKHRALYHLLYPVQKVIGWVPWFVLQSLVLLPLLFIIQYRW